MIEKEFQNIDQYIALFPAETQKILQEIRHTIHVAAPSAVETISYGMPAFKTSEVLVYFAAQKDHIGFYPTSSPIKVFTDELKNYSTSKGTVRFKIDLPIPYDLIAKIVSYRLNEVKIKDK